MLSVLGASLGFREFPLPDRGKPPPLLGFEEAVHLTGEAETISPSAKLHFLHHMAHRVSSRESLLPIAESLIVADDPETVGQRQLRAQELQAQPQPREQELHGQRQLRAQRLLELVFSTPLGQDPLEQRRTWKPLGPVPLVALAGDEEEPEPSGGIFPEILVNAFVPGVEESRVIVEPQCQASTEMVQRRPALSLLTTVETEQRLRDMSSVPDPLTWHLCHPQSMFFKQMTQIDPALPPPTALRGPETGWTARIHEVVDFSYGLNPLGTSVMRTDLDFVYFRTDTAVGCTYDLHRSRRNKIEVDRGYVLVEDLRSRDLRRTTTQKQVYFRSRPQFGDVCELWSMAHGFLNTSCSTR
jgi:hypothetical protein